MKAVALFMVCVLACGVASIAVGQAIATGPAGAEEFASPQAKEAQARYNTAIRPAKERYLADLRAISAKLPENDAERTGKLAETIRRLETELAAVPTTPDRKEITYDATSGWVDSGIQVQKGQKVTITVAGWYALNKTMPPVDPDGYKPIRTENVLKRNCSLGKFLASVIPNREYYYEIGKGATFTSASTGDLWIGLNDTYVADNSGKVTVSISIQR